MAVTDGLSKTVVAAAITADHATETEAVWNWEGAIQAADAVVGFALTVRLIVLEVLAGHDATPLPMEIHRIAIIYSDISLWFKA